MYNLATKQNGTCDDCGKAPGLHVYFFHNERCDACDKVFQDKLHAERVAEHERERARLAAHVCGASDDSDDICQSCCEHDRDPDEGMMCLNCNAEWDGP